MPKSRRHYRLTEADAASAHDRALSVGGGRDGIRDYSLVLSALGRPYTGYYRRIWDKAAAFTESMARNHGYVDGNKRTTVLLMLLLIDQSGYDLLPSQRGEDLGRAIEEMILWVVNDRPPIDQIVDWYKKRIQEAM